MIEKTFPIADTLLGKGLELSQKLFDLLIREADGLKNRETPDNLLRLAATKKETVVQLEQFTKQLAQVLTTESLTLSEANMTRYFDIAGAAGLSTSATQGKWRRIADLAKNSRTLNEQNGAAIDLLLKHNHRLSQILRGKSQFSTTYGPDGSTHTDRFSQPLISV